MKHKTSGILKIGVTGGIGSGKSSVCRIFESLGVPVFYADDIAKDISVRSPAVREKITGLLGMSAYRPDGSLDREFVADKIFSQKGLQKRLNAIVHPEVEKEVERLFVDAEMGGSPLAIVEAALIYEAGLYKRLDIVIVVDSDENLRLKRLAGSDPKRREEMKKRMNAQWNPQTKLKRADFVILNNGTLEQLEEKVKFIYTIFNNLGAH